MQSLSVPKESTETSEEEEEEEEEEDEMHITASNHGTMPKQRLREVVGERR